MVDTHCPSVWQVDQLLFRQTWLAMQSQPAIQFPAEHCVVLVQAVQALLMQTWPPLQPALS